MRGAGNAVKTALTAFQTRRLLLKEKEVVPWERFCFPFREDTFPEGV